MSWSYAQRGGLYADAEEEDSVMVEMLVGKKTVNGRLY
jgi:hypothetical protein